MNHYFKQFIFILLCVVSISQTFAHEYVERSYTGDELYINWSLYDTYSKHSIEWNGVNTIYYKGRSYITIRSNFQFADVAKIEISYTVNNSAIYVVESVNVDTLIYETSNAEGVSNLVIWNKPDGTKPQGYIDIKTWFKNGHDYNVTINSITVTYDVTGVNRELQWSSVSADATLGDDFTLPTLSGKNLDSVMYSSSNINVATVDPMTGAVKLVDQGETTITAKASTCGMWIEDSTSYLLTVTLPSSYVSETINVETPGTLQELFIDLPTRPKALKLTGTINADDINYINSGLGKIAYVSKLDLSEVNLERCDTATYSYYNIGLSDGMGSINIRFAISDNCRIDTVYSLTGLGGYNRLYTVYNNSLAGAFMNNQTLTRVILPKSLPSVGMYIGSGSKLESVVMPDVSTEIGDYAFNNSSIQTVDIPATVKKIGKFAFKGSSILSITLPEACMEVGDYAFAETQLKQINLGNVRILGVDAFRGAHLSGTVDLRNIKTIPEYAFLGCDITGIEFSTLLKEIGTEAFSGNINIRSIVLPEGLEAVGNYAFYKCDQLRSIVIPETLVTIGDNAFPSGWVENNSLEDGNVIYIGKVAYALASTLTPVSELCFKEGTVSISPNLFGYFEQTFANGIKRIVFPSSLRYIGDKISCVSNAFASMPALEEVVLNDGLIMIGSGAFSSCTNLDVMYWPESLEYIGDDAFCRTKVGSLTLGKNLKYLGDNSFTECNSLYELKLLSTNINCFQKFALPGLETVTIGADVTKIPDYFLHGSMPNLHRITIEAGEKPLEIGEYAFCSFPLVFDSFPRKISSVGACAFESCEFSCDLDLSACTNFGYRAFCESSGLTTIVLDTNIEFIGDGAFSYITTLDSIYYNVPSTEKYYVQGNYFIKIFNGCGGRTLVIGPDVEYISKNEFREMEKLENVIFKPRDAEFASKSLLIDNGAFYWCINLKTLVLPNCQTTIGDRVFDECNNLKEVKLGEGTEAMGASVFSYGLESVDFPSSFITFTGNYAFSSAQNLKYLYFHSTEVPTGLANQSINANATIYVPASAVENFQANVSCTVLPYDIESFAISDSELCMCEGETKVLGIMISPSEYNGLKVDWNSSSPEVVSVDAFGNVTAHSIGEAYVTASIAYIDGYSNSCKVIVSNTSSIEDIISSVDRICIETFGGVLTIKNAPIDTEVKIYSISGMLVACSKKHTFNNLTSGVYIVVVAGETFKIII